MTKLYIIDLSPAEQDRLVELTNKGQTAARKIKRANILLLAETGKTDLEIAQILHTSLPTVERTRRRFVVGGLEFALTEQTRPGRSLKLDDKVEAILTTLAQSVPPAGQKRWTLQMLANRLVELKVIGSISDETVRRVLKKRSETVAAPEMVYTHRDWGGVCLADGGHSGFVRRALLPASASGLLRRTALSID